MTNRAFKRNSDEKYFPSRVLVKISEYKYALFLQSIALQWNLLTCSVMHTISCFFFAFVEMCNLYYSVYIYCVTRYWYIYVLYAFLHWVELLWFWCFLHFTGFCDKTWHNHVTHLTVLHLIIKILNLLVDWICQKNVSASKANFWVKFAQSLGAWILDSSCCSTQRHMKMLFFSYSFGQSLHLLSSEQCTRSKDFIPRVWNFSLRIRRGIWKSIILQYFFLIECRRTKQQR